jgi:hypothetical protein
MDAELLQTHWALAAAVVVLALLGLVLGIRRAALSGYGALWRCRRRLARERRALARVERAVASAERRLARLRERARATPPRLLAEAGEALEDARALERIARDRVQIAENHLRRVIFEEFAPVRQERLRAKYLPETPPDKRPFSF